MLDVCISVLPTTCLVTNLFSVMTYISGISINSCAIYYFILWLLLSVLLLKAYSLPASPIEVFVTY